MINPKSNSTDQLIGDHYGALPKRTRTRSGAEPVHGRLSEPATAVQWSDRLNGYLRSHLIDPSLLRAGSFDAFMADRQKQLLALIEQATGKAAYLGTVQEEGEEAEADEDTAEAEFAEQQLLIDEAGASNS